MPEPQQISTAKRWLLRARAGLREASWTLGAAVFVVVALMAARRIGLVEGALAAFLVVLAALLAPRRRAPLADDPKSQAETLSTQLDAILSGLPDPVLVLDRRGAITGFNAHARAALGEIRIGEPVSFSLRIPEVLEAVRGAGVSGAPQTVLYVERVPVERWREAHVAATRLVEGEPKAIVISLRDLTEQRRSERMRGDFVANASHELRTPLASLLGFIETLQGPARNDPAAREKFLEIMRAQANRMSRLIDDLLSLSRIELKAHVRPRDVVDLASLVRGVADALAPLARERGVELDLSAARAEVHVRGDRDELIRVAENLIENAIKYGQSGKRVEVGVEDAADGPRLVVRDFGPGVAPEHLPRLTERFYRVDVAESRDKGGTGLGLALVKHILQRHGGRLTIESAAGAGATFTAVLRRANVAKPDPKLLKRAS
ncbi:ATP-binding protein [Methylopila sp. M107]|uniref:ATP-binding protein n=1 Tax=Methylopila sp. M107 TaxID=1101190 RepID=UPI0003A102E4|nr:ATP-binding protein [Methylopila sp. M107]